MRSVCVFNNVSCLFERMNVMFRRTFDRWARKRVRLLGKQLTDGLPVCMFSSKNSTFWVVRALVKDNVCTRWTAERREHTITNYYGLLFL